MSHLFPFLANESLLMTTRYMFSALHSHSAAQYDVPWPEDYLVIFFRRLCLILYSLHQLNVSHEDLKRSNVMVDPHGWPALIDFGFSHFAAYGQSVKSAGGTLDYTSPEKAEVSSDPEGIPLTVRTDTITAA